MFWKVNDVTYSGLKFENKSVELFPNSRIKVNSCKFYSMYSHNRISGANYLRKRFFYFCG